MSINDAGIKISSGFNLRTGIPLDLRAVRDTTVDRDAIPLNYRYEGLQCYVKNIQTLYSLRGGVTNAYWVPECCVKYNLAATTAPTITNNESEGYSEKSIWYDTVNENTYLLINFAGTDATWIKINNFNWTSTNW